MLTLVSFIFLVIGVVSSSSFQPFSPPAVPLAVRSPYLSAWLARSGSGTVLNDVWPTFWNGDDILGWAGFINVDGVSYCWMGSPAVADTTFNQTSQQSLTITSTQSTFEMTAGPIDLTINFLSPVEASDLVNISLPFSYLSLTAKPNDGNSHKVSIYTDISAEWTSGNDSMIVNWTTSTSSGAVIHQVQLENQTTFLDVDNRIQYGSTYYATLQTSGLSYQTGRDIDVRAQFINNSVLLNTSDTEYRAISDDWPVFAFAEDLGSISDESDPMVIAIGLVRDPVISYVTTSGQQDRSSYFWTRWSTIEDAITTFLGDYTNAVVRATNFDSAVRANASNTAYPPNYVSIVELSIRQALYPIEVTVSQDSSGNYNTSDVTAFMREISSATHVNCVDCIYAAWPAFLYTNPALAKALLIPLLEYAATGLYPNDFAVHDLGADYPQAPGWPSGGDLQLPVEETGNMLIMTLSAVQWTGDTSLIEQYYSQLEKWASYLDENTLYPVSQDSSDTFAGALANQTNLAIKGIIGLQAMAEMASLIGDSGTSSKYGSIASSYVSEWQKAAMAASGLHLTLNYGNSSSWGLVYNFYADQLLNTSLIPSSVYELQTAWYGNIIQNGNYPYGLPLDTRYGYAVSGWEIWTAAIVTLSSVRENLINPVYSFADDQLNAVPLPDFYNTSSGKMIDFQARPQVGGHLALLVLNSTNSTSSGSPTSSSSASASSSTSTTPTESKSSGSTSLSDNLIHSLALSVGMAALVALL